MGTPLGGTPFISETAAAQAPSQWRATIVAARSAGAAVTEVRALQTLHGQGRLRADERARLVALLARRALQWDAMGRQPPFLREVSQIDELQPGASAAALQEARADRTWAVVPPCDSACVLSQWALQGPTVAARLLPLIARGDSRVPGDGQVLSASMAAILVDEDPTSPDVLELAALIYGVCGNDGAAARAVTDMVYHAPDRAFALERAARVWERLGQKRRACAAWSRLARWNDRSDDLAWRRVLACVQRDPRNGDEAAIRRYLVARGALPARDAGLAPDARPGDTRPGER